ncbi:MAG: hypothetical protein R3F11_03910 [Verrucomicrobiales bacterium]
MKERRPDRAAGDADGDGRYARKATFASGLRFPTGLLPWRGGLIVTDAPDVLYLRDTDGDGAADQREVWLTGFATDKTTQLRVNDPTLGPDGWIYFAGGLSAGKVTSPLCPDKAPADLARGDLRFNPHSPDYEVTTGKSQFGMAFDAYGRRFLCMNRVQVQHAVLTRAQLARNPGLAFSETVQNLPEGRVDDLLRGDNAAARIYPISANVTTADSHAGTFSAACAVAVWRGGNLPERYAGRAFSCDPTGNLAHWDDLVPDGATFVARRSAERREFLASPDNAFRPVFLAGGPDGALYVCDMARATIEHPQYLPEEVRKRTDFQTGRAEGRIWRVRSAGDARVAPEALPEDPAALVALLGSPNGWAQGSAFRRLAERPGELPADALHLYAREGAEPAGRAAALNLLALAGSLADAEIIAAFADPHPGVRETALRHAESRASKASDGLKSAVADLADDEDARVRFCCALAMAGLGIDFGLEKIALKGASDRWTRAAVITAAASREEELADSVIGLAEEIGYPDGFGELMKALSAAQIANAKDFSREDFVSMSEGVSEEFVAIGSPAWFFDAMVGVADGFAARGERGVLREAAAAHDLSAIAEAARAAAPDNESALRVLGLMGRAEDGAFLLDLLRKTGDAERQALLVEALGDSGMEGAPAALGDSALFNRLLPAARERALARFGRANVCQRAGRRHRSESGRRGGDLARAAQRVAQSGEGRSARPHGSALHRRRGGPRGGVRKGEGELALNGDPANGRGVFTQLCAVAIGWTDKASPSDRSVRDAQPAEGSDPAPHHRAEPRDRARLRSLPRHAKSRRARRRVARRRHARPRHAQTRRRHRTTLRPRRSRIAPARAGDRSCPTG